MTNPYNETTLWESTTTIREKGVVTDVEWDCWVHVNTDQEQQRHDRYMQRADERLLDHLDQQVSHDHAADDDVDQ